MFTDQFDTFTYRYVYQNYQLTQGKTRFYFYSSQYIKFYFLGSEETFELEGAEEIETFQGHHPTTPDSSQTESDDVSPQIQRKRRLQNRDNVPKFSISIEDDHSV